MMSLWGLGKICAKTVLVSLGMAGHEPVRNLYLDSIEAIFCEAYPEVPDPNIFQRKACISRIKAEDFQSVMSEFIDKTQAYLNDSAVKKLVFDEYPQEQQLGFTEKINLKSGSVIIQIGDLHGSLHTLLRILRRLQIMNYLNEDFTINRVKPCHIVFMGDYVDRVPYGVEVLFLALYLKIINWQHVSLLRGNHEALKINSFPNEYGGGFLKEIRDKYPKQADVLIDILGKCYTCLPLSVFVKSGNACVQFCHGGFDPRYNPKAFLDDESTRIQKISSGHLTTGTVESCGLLWTSFVTYHEERLNIFEKSLKLFESIGGLSLEQRRNALHERFKKSLEKFTTEKSVRGDNLFFIDCIYAQYICDQAGINALVRGHDDREGVCALLDKKPKNDQKWSEDWKSIVTPDEVAGKSFLMARYGPVFTSTTPSACKLDTIEGFTIIRTADTYSAWTMSVHEYALPSLSFRQDNFCSWSRWADLGRCSHDMLKIHWS